jgi:hypothetical protein
VHKVPLVDVKALENWCKCDLESLDLLEKTIAELRDGVIASDELMLLNKPGISEDVWNRLLKLKSTIDSPALAEFRKVSKLPWYPIMWDDASYLFQISVELFLKLT